MEFLQGAVIDEKRREGGVPIVRKSAAGAFCGFRTRAGQRGDKGLGGTECAGEGVAGGGETLVQELLKVCEAPVIRGCTWPMWHIRRERGRGWFAEGTDMVGPSR